MEKKLFSTAALFGMTAIIIGAFGAHALKKYLTIAQLTSFETGVKYQMYHALLLLFVGITTFLDEKTKKQLFYLITLGVIFFSGSIYILSIGNIYNYSFSYFGIITPIGGLLLIISWAIFGLAAYKKNV